MCTSPAHWCSAFCSFPWHLLVTSVSWALTILSAVPALSRVASAHGAIIGRVDGECISTFGLHDNPEMHRAEMQKRKP